MRITRTRHCSVGPARAPHSETACQGDAPADKFLPSSNKSAEEVPPWDDPAPWTEFQRNSKLLSQDGDVKTLSGVRWGFDEVGSREDWPSRFFDTTIDTSAVKSAYLGVEQFNGFGHSFLVLEFDKDKPMTTPEGESDNKLVLSIEAWRKQGETWEMPKAFGSKYAILYQLSTFGDYAQGLSRKFLDPMRIHKLDLTPEETKKLADTVIDEAVKDRRGDYYHATADSCYSGLLRVINKALPEDEQVSLDIWPTGLQRPTTMWPQLGPTVLKRSGLISDDPSISFPTDSEMGEVTGKLGTFGKVMQGVAKTGLMPFTGRLAGVTGGAYGGYQLGGLFGLPEAGAAVGGVAGYMMGGFWSDHLQTRYYTVETSAEPFYPKPPKE